MRKINTVKQKYILARDAYNKAKEEVKKETRPLWSNAPANMSDNDLEEYFIKEIEIGNRHGLDEKMIAHNNAQKELFAWAYQKTKELMEKHPGINKGVDVLVCFDWNKIRLHPNLMDKAATMALNLPEN